MNLNQMYSFLDAMHKHDLEGIKAGLADSVTIKSPIVPEPFRGKDQVMSVLEALLKIADEFNVREVLTSDGDGRQVAVILSIRAGTTEVEGVDYLSLDEQGLVDSMTIQWRPLPAIVEMQNKIAPGLGIPALALVPR